MTLLIKNVRIVGGARKFPESSDVFVSRDRISAIGNFPNKRAAQVLDGQGAYLSPGFIDVNTDSDHYFTLFDYPSQDDFLKQGVTTIFGGMCGSSLAPLLYGSLESIRKWTNADKANVNWHTMAEFLGAIDKRPLGVNFGTMAGHGTIRRAIVGDSLRNLTKNELGVFSGILQKAMKEGAFGLSTGLGYVHARTTPYAEIRSLAGIAKNFHGIYATHLRDSVPLTESVTETIRLTKETGIATLINHFVPLIREAKEYPAALALIEDLSEEFNFHFDIYPFSETLMPFYTFLPLWAQTGGWQAMLHNVKDEWLLPRMIKEMPPIDEDYFTVAQAPANDFLVGKTLRDIKEMYGIKDAREALLHLMAAMDLRGVAFHKNIDEKLLMKALASKRSLIASNAPSFGEAKKIRQLKSERTTGTFTKFLSLAEKDGLMPLDEAIRKITQIPARMFGLAGRGEIKEGNFADLMCFKDGVVKFTVVNGGVAVKNGEFQNVFAGRAFRHHSTTL
jgi:N-acyl-D-aspartate/D-glutamate deacylase